MKNARQFVNCWERRGPVNFSIFTIGLLLSMSQVMAEKSNPEPGLAVDFDGDGHRIGLLNDGYDGEVIVIEGPVTSRQEGRTKLGFPIEIIELKGRVSYADLDLSKEADVTVFRSRVEAAAKKSCEKLAHRHSVELTGRWTITRCTNEAIDRSVEQMQAAIDADH
jgi:UrcA family protein